MPRLKRNNAGAKVSFAFSEIHSNRCISFLEIPWLEALQDSMDVNGASSSL